MTTIPCLYAVVRFAPFVETGEFANVGIILLAPGHGYFHFKLMEKSYARVTQFFAPLDKQVFRNSVNNLQDELLRVQQFLQQERGDAEFAKQMFQEIIRPRETLIKFGQAGGILSKNPAATLDELYERYVNRKFADQEYRETQLNRSMRDWMGEIGLTASFTKLEIGNEEYHAAFPFVQQIEGQAYKAIKPLHLGQEKASKIIDHGGAWMFRIATLRRKKLLSHQVLFAVEGPQQDDARGRAFHETVAQMREMDVAVIDFADKENILQFIHAN